MSDLSEFLLARIAEDEAAARAAEHADGPETLEWRRGGQRNHRFDNDRSEHYESVFAGNWDRILVARDDGRVAAHIARWDPARVLAECEAKRRIVELHTVVVTSEWVNPPGGPAYQEPERTCVICGWVPGACDTVKALALPYADHPDYRSEWKP